jgi:DNA repair protein RadA/Sms
VARRVAEAARLGFTKALVPPDSGDLPGGVKTVVVPDLRAALGELSP